jgi:hypothetical protein
MGEGMEPKTFDELVTRLAWYVVEQLLRGEGLRSIIYSVACRARTWKPPKENKRSTRRAR